MGQREVLGLSFCLGSLETQVYSILTLEPANPGLLVSTNKILSCSVLILPEEVQEEVAVRVLEMLIAARPVRVRHARWR